jgi:hypothetical protein
MTLNYDDNVFEEYSQKQKYRIFSKFRSLVVILNSQLHGINQS